MVTICNVWPLIGLFLGVIMNQKNRVVIGGAFWLRKLLIAVTLVTGSGWSLAPAPLVFDYVGSDDASQQAEWDELLKYKLFGRDYFQIGHSVEVTERSGYTGTVGNMTMSNTVRNILGPIVVGGSMGTHGGNGPWTDIYDSGYVRVGGDLWINGNANASTTVFNDHVCVHGAIQNKSKATFAKTASEGTASCAQGFPELNTALNVPTMPATGWVGSLPSLTGNSTVGNVTIDGSASTASCHAEPAGNVCDYYFTSIDLGNNTDLIVKQSAGDITRIFVKELNLTNESSIYVATADGTLLDGDSYNGSLLIFAEEANIQDGTKTIMGSLISGSHLKVTGGMSLYGQLIAQSMEIENDFNSINFNYVPFDPPQLDPTALASGVFSEGLAGDQPIQITLDRNATIDVSFKYYILAPGSVDKGADTANANDFAGTWPSSVATARSVMIQENSKVPSVLQTLQIGDDILNEGTETFFIVIFDLQGAVLPNDQRTDTLALSIVDNDQEQPPVAQDAQVTLPENSPVGTEVHTVQATDENVDAVLSYAIVGGNTFNAFAIDPATGLITVQTPSVLNFEGTPNVWELVVRVTDNTLLTDESTITIQLENVNEGSVALDKSYTAIEDVLLTVPVATGLAQGAVDTDGDALTVVVKTLPSHGSLSWNANGSFTYLGQINYNGPDAFTYVVKDPSGLESAVQTVTITVTPVNDIPLALNSSYTVLEDDLLTVGVAQGLLVGATDVENEALQAISVTAPTHGTLVLATDGSFTYQPELNFNGSDSFTFRVQDESNGLSTVQTVSITVTPVNDAPVILVQNLDFETPEDTPLNVSVAQGVLAGASDVDGDPLTAVLVSDVAHGTLTLYADGHFGYVPQANYFGEDSFTFQVDDGSLASAVYTATITIHSVNDVPVGLAHNYNMLEDQVLTVGLADGLLQGASDVEGNLPLVVALLSAPEFGELTLQSNGAFTYTPEHDFFGRDQFTFKIIDGIGGESVPYTASIQVADVNDPPTLLDRPQTVPENVPGGYVVGSVVATDPDADKLTYQLVSGEGFLIDPNGLIRVLPSTQLDYETQSVYHLTISVSDGAGHTVQGQVTITVLDMPEHTDVVIVSAQSGDSTWKYPDTIWVNQAQVLVGWTSDGQLKSDPEVVAENKKTLLIKSDMAPGKDVAGADTLVVFMNNKKPEIIFELPPVRPEPIPGITVVEPVDPTDPVIYINNKEKEIPVTVVTVGKELQQVVIQDTIHPNLVEGINTVSYTYTDIYGNQSVKTIQVFLDLTPPVVKIVSPEERFQTDNVVQFVEWTVDGQPMNILNLQSLKKGVNQVIRTYRDRAGNEGSDTVMVLFVQGKDIDIALEKDLVRFDASQIAKYYSVSPPQENELYSLSVLNNQTGLEEKTLYGKGASTYTADGSEPYPGLGGTHLGPTLRMRVRLPQMGGTDVMGNPRGGLLSDLVDANGRVMIQAGMGSGSTGTGTGSSGTPSSGSGSTGSGSSSGSGSGTISGDTASLGQQSVSLQEYVESYCLDGYFDGLSTEQILAMPQFESQLDLSVHIFDVNGQFVDRMRVTQKIEDADYLDDDGVVTLYYELKPSKEYGLIDVTGRQYGTGVYIMDAKVNAISKRLCDSPAGSKGERIRSNANDLVKFGYQRPHVIR